MKHIVLLLMLTVGLVACTGNDDQPAAETPSEETSGDAEHGEELFRMGKGTEAPPCSTCHRVEEGGSGLALGPGLEDIASRAATRVEGMSAEEYLRESILDPEAYEVSGYRVGMFSGYGEYFSGQDVADLVAYLLSL